MYCKWCEDHGLAPFVTDVDGTLSSVSGQPGVWAHACEDSWWPCDRKAAELRAFEVLAVEWVQTEAAMVAKLNSSPDPESAIVECEAWDEADEAFRAACHALAAEAEKARE